MSKSEKITALYERLSRDEISIVLLDFIMSGIDGLGVLNVMNKEHLIEDL